MLFENFVTDHAPVAKTNKNKQTNKPKNKTKTNKKDKEKLKKKKKKRQMTFVIFAPVELYAGELGVLSKNWYAP